MLSLDRKEVKTSYQPPINADRIWESRQNFTACVAMYIALAEVTGSVLHSRDEKLRGGHRARVVLFRS
jgi:predicted nucleic acid-binding protein